MGKKSKKTTPSTASALPKAPWLYINDPTTDTPHARYLRSLIPSCVTVPHADHEPSATTSLSAAQVLTSNLRTGAFDDCVVIVTDNLPDSKDAEKVTTAEHIRAEAIKHGVNFASVNLYTEMESSEAQRKTFGTNHLEVKVSGMTVEEVATKIYRWLFTALTVQETLHLISESEMLAVDDKVFPDYAYCPINESKSRPKDAKIQFVALVTSRPAVNGQRLQWTVADRTGTANFYFQYRGPVSQYTWDWVLKLQPGERRALPRMPLVEVKERKRVRVLKAPFRGVGLMFTGVGLVVKGVGHGMAKIGEVSKLGKSSEWVPEEDVVDGKKVDWSKTFEKERVEQSLKVERAEAAKRSIKVFNEKGSKLWKDDDSVASTTLGAEKINEKEFC